jgi:predicted phage tail protein
MSPKERASAKSGVPGVEPAQLAEISQKQVEAIAGMQQELVNAIDEMSRQWAARMKAETDLASEFAGKLSEARSAPDTARIVQEWLSRRMDLFAEDSRRFVADSQKFMAAATRMLSAGGRGGNT